MNIKITTRVLCLLILNYLTCVTISDNEFKRDVDSNHAVINDEKSEESNEDDEKSDNNNIPSIPQDGVKLLIILVDGFRYDYVQKDRSLKGFPRIAREGVRAQHVTPIFPANSYPNWYAITTGLYSESHGMVQNIMYDKKHDDVFLMVPHPNASHPFWWNQTEPLWITSEKSGVKSALYLWDGCQVEISGYKPSICVPYKSLYEYPAVSNETRKILHKVLDDFKEDKYRLAMVYYEYVDHTGHYNGPLTKKNKQAIRDIDDILFELQDSIKRLNLQDDVNVVVVSDHGMLDCQHFDEIQMDEILDFNDVELFLDGGALAMILPEEGKEDSVYEQLRQAKVKRLNVYKKENIPESFHFKNNDRIMPILITTDRGSLIAAPAIDGKVYPLGEEISRGNHGFDPAFVEEMRGIMYAFGPAFRRNYVGVGLSQVDHYNLFCDLLEIKGHPNNGTWERVEKLLKLAEQQESEELKSEEDNSDYNRNNSFLYQNISFILVCSIIMNLIYYKAFN